MFSLNQMKFNSQYLIELVRNSFSAIIRVSSSAPNISAVRHMCCIGKQDKISELGRVIKASY